MYIGIVGCMGIGKTKLTQALASHLRYRAFYEPVRQNPYLDDFYSDMPAYAFKNQLFVLTHRFRQHLEIQELHRNGVGVLQDQLLFVDALYAKLAHELKVMDDRDFSTYTNLFGTIKDFIILPTVIVHLRTPVTTIQERIRERGRASEKEVSKKYLQLLSDFIDEWTKSISAGTQVIQMDWTTYQPVEDVVKQIEDRLQVQLILPVR